MVIFKVFHHRRPPRRAATFKSQSLLRTYLKFGVIEISLGHMDVDLDVLALIIGVDELGLTNEGCTLVAMIHGHDGHPGSLLDRPKVGIEGLGDLWRVTNHLVEDIDLVLD
jgi:hypothetical protein